MRLFVSIDVASEIRQELERRTAAFRGDLPRARWVKPTAMHLTLVFLGETAEERLQSLHRELGDAFRGCEPMSLAVAGCGAFPPRGRKRVLWTGIEAEGDLGGLQARVAEAVERATGIESERRPYHPHLTLARCKPAWAAAEAERFSASFGEQPVGTFRVEQGHLMASKLTPAGAQYRTIESYPLGGRH